MVSDARGDAVVGSEVKGGGESIGLRGVLWWKEEEEEWVKSKGRGRRSCVLEAIGSTCWAAWVFDRASAPRRARLNKTKLLLHCGAAGPCNIILGIKIPPFPSALRLLHHADGQSWGPSNMEKAKARERSPTQSSLNACT
jgi:hypothetical protein